MHKQVLSSFSLLILSLILCTLYFVNETLRVANIIGGIFRRAMTDINNKGINYYLIITNYIYRQIRYCITI